MDRRRAHGRCVAILAVAALLGGCAGAGESLPLVVGAPDGTSTSPAAPAASSTPVSTPTQLPPQTASPAPPSAAGLRQFDLAARAFVDRFNARWADAKAAFSGFTPDAVIIDPTNMDYTIGPGPDIVEAWGSFARAVPEYRATTTSAFVSDTVAAFATEVAGLPVALPDGLLHELRVFRFVDPTATGATAMELWYELGDRLADPQNTRLDCVAPDRCADDVTAFADWYLAAWTSGDAARIAQLYSPGATVADGARGTRATGVAEIGKLSDARFGGSTAACEARDLYVQADGADPRTSDNTDPSGGSIAGIAIAYRCELGSTHGGRTVDGLALLLFGTRQARSFDNDPLGRIVTEEVLYDAASVIAAGVVR